MNVHEPAAWTALRHAGLVQGAAPAAALEAPWYVRVMLGVAGWIAALFLLGFVAAGMTWLIESEWACVAGGLLGSGAAWLLLRKLGHNEFAAQFALAVSFAGQALFAYGVFNLLDESPDSPAVWLLLALQQAALVVLMPNATHRLWSGFAAAAALTLALRAGGGAFLAPGLLLGAAAWAWLNEFRWPRYVRCCARPPMAWCWPWCSSSWRPERCGRPPASTSIRRAGRAAGQHRRRP